MTWGDRHEANWAILTASGRWSAGGWGSVAGSAAEPAALQVGTSAVNLKADDAMVIAGGIGPGKAQGQEGELRATAIVLAQGSTQVAIVSCDVLMLTRDLLDPVAAEIESTCGIPASQVLIHTTHTHHAPSTMRVHAYDRDETFCREVQQAIVQGGARGPAAIDRRHVQFPARPGDDGRTEQPPAAGAMARSTGSGQRDDATGPTGPFDPDLPVLAFRDPRGQEPGRDLRTLDAHDRQPASPACVRRRFTAWRPSGWSRIWAARSVSWKGPPAPPTAWTGEAAEASQRIEAAVRTALAEANVQERPHTGRPQAAVHVSRADVRRTGGRTGRHRLLHETHWRPAPKGVIDVFRNMRKELAAQQGQERTTWIQTIRIGDVAIVGVPAEFFTGLGVDIKRRSPFEHTFIAELSNDWIGYLPDREGHQLGGYQVWTGFHSYAEPGTGERWSTWPWRCSGNGA